MRVKITAQSAGLSTRCKPGLWDRIIRFGSRIATARHRRTTVLLAAFCHHSHLYPVDGFSTHSRVLIPMPISSDSLRHSAAHGT